MSAPFWYHTKNDKPREELEISERLAQGPKVSELFERMERDRAIVELPRERYVAVIAHVAPPAPPPVPAPPVQQPMIDTRTTRERWVEEMRGRTYGRRS